MWPDAHKMQVRCASLSHTLVRAQSRLLPVAPETSRRRAGSTIAPCSSEATITYALSHARLKVLKEIKTHIAGA
jgi:hypothetical protein